MIRFIVEVVAVVLGLYIGSAIFNVDPTFGEMLLVVGAFFFSDLVGDVLFGEPR